MPPKAMQSLAQPIESLRNQIAELVACTSSDEAYQLLITMHKSLLQILENVTVAIKNSENSILESDARSIASRRKPMSESRCVSSLKLLGSDKSEFKNWNEKLINTLSQSLGKPWRIFMENLNRKLDQDRKVLELDELNEIEGADLLEEHDSCSEDLYCVLAEKTEGDVALRVNSG